MKYTVEFTDTASEDLCGIAFYIFENAKDKDVAKSFVKELAEKCSVLEDYPLTGAVPNDRILKISGYRFLVHKDYLIFYIVDEPKLKVYIHAVFNAKKDYVRVLSKIK